MGVNFYFIDRVNGKKSDFTCENIKNGIIPICSSVSDKDGKFKYRIYNPHHKLHQKDEPIIIDNIKNWQFGTWICKINNQNGMVMVNSVFKIDGTC